MFIQAMRRDLWEHLGGEQGMMSRLKAQSMTETHVVKDGFIWPKAQVEQQAMKTLKACMQPWGSVDERYRLEVEKWGEYKYQPFNVKGMRKLCGRPSGSVGGPPFDPNVWISAEQAGPSITASANTRAVPQMSTDGKAWGVRMLTPFECLRANGVKEDLQMSLGDGWRYLIAGNAVVRQTAEVLAEGTKLYYDNSWMQKHVKDCVREDESYGHKPEWTERRPKGPQSINRYQVKTNAGMTLEQNVEDAIGKANELEAWKARKAQYQANKEAGRIVEGYQRCGFEKRLRKQRHVRTAGEPGRVTALGAMKGRQALAQRNDLLNREEINSIEGEGKIQQDDGPIEHGEEAFMRDGGVKIARHTMTVRNKRSRRKTEIKVKEYDPATTNKDIKTILETPVGTRSEEIWKDLAKRQRMDTDLRTIAEYCDEGIVPTCPIRRQVLETAEKYVTKHGVVYRISENKKIPEDSWIQLCVPESLRTKLIEDIHTNLGHPKQDAMYRLLKQRYYWDRMHNDCTLWVKYCDSCQRYKEPQPKMGQVGYTQLSSETGIPAHTLIMDVIGPYGSKEQKSSQGNRCALVIQDEFTRFVQVYPAARVTAEFVGACVEEWIRYIGRPRHIKSDRGRNLIAKGLNIYYGAAGILKTESSALRPQSHGRIERVNLFIHSGLRATLAGQTTEWDAKIQAMAEAWNQTPCVSLEHRSPRWLMLGRKAYNVFEEQYGWAPTEDEYTRSEWVRKAVRALQLEWQACAEGLVRYKTSVLQSQARRFKEKEPPQFKTGDRVKIFLACVPSGKGLARKLLGRWTADYEIVDKKGSHTYAVRRLNAEPDEASVPIHVERIKRYYSHEGEHLTPHVTLQQYAEEDEESPADRRITDEMLGITKNPTLVAEDDLERMQSGLAQAAPTELSEGWDLPLTMEQRTEQRLEAQTWADKRINEELDDSSMKETMARDRVRHVATQEEEDEESDDEEVAQAESAGMRTQRATKIDELARDLGMRTSKFINLNDKLFYANLTGDYKIPKGVVVRTHMDKDTKLSAKAKEAMAQRVQVYRRGDMGDWRKQWDVEAIDDCRSTAKGLEYRVRWKSKDGGPKDVTYTWEPEINLTACKEVLRSFKDKQIQAKNKGGTVASAMQTRGHQAEMFNMESGEPGEDEEVIYPVYEQHPELEEEVDTTAEGTLIRELQQDVADDGVIPDEEDLKMDEATYEMIAGMGVAPSTADDTEEGDVGLMGDGTWRIQGPKHTSTRWEQQAQVKRALRTLQQRVKLEECETLDLRELMPYMRRSEVRQLLRILKMTRVDRLLMGDERWWSYRTGKLLKQYMPNTVNWVCSWRSKRQRESQELENHAGPVSRALWITTTRQVRMERIEEMSGIWRNIRMGGTKGQETSWRILRTELRRYFELSGGAIRTDNMEEEQARRVMAQAMWVYSGEPCSKHMCPPSVTELESAIVGIDEHGLTSRVQVEQMKEMKTTPDGVMVMERLETDEAGSRVLQALKKLKQAANLETWGLDLGYAEGLQEEDWLDLAAQLKGSRVIRMRADVRDIRKGIQDALLRTLQENGRKEFMGMELPTRAMAGRTRQNMDEDGMCWSVRQEQVSRTEDVEREPDCRPSPCPPTPSAPKAEKQFTRGGSLVGIEPRVEQVISVPDAPGGTEQGWPRMVIWCQRQGDREPEFLEVMWEPDKQKDKRLRELMTWDRQTRSRIDWARRVAKAWIRRTGLSACVIPEPGLEWTEAGQGSGNVNLILLKYSDKRVIAERLRQSWGRPWQWQRAREWSQQERYAQLAKARRTTETQGRWWTHEWDTTRKVQRRQRGGCVEAVCQSSVGEGQTIEDVEKGSRRMSCGEMADRSDQFNGWAWTGCSLKGIQVYWSPRKLSREVSDAGEPNCEFDAKGLLRACRDIKSGELIRIKPNPRYRLVKGLIGDPEDGIKDRVDEHQWQNWCSDMLEAVKTHGVGSTWLWWNGLRIAWSDVWKHEEWRGSLRQRRWLIAGQEARAPWKVLTAEIENLRRHVRMTEAGLKELWRTMESHGVARDIVKLAALRDRSKMRGGEDEEERPIMERLQEMEVLNADQASAFLHLYEKHYGLNKEIALRDRKIAERWHLSLNLLRDRVEKSKDKECDMIRDVEIVFSPAFESNGIAMLNMRGDQLRTGKSDPAKGADVRIEYKEGEETKFMMGTVQREDRKNNEGDTEMTIRISKAGERPDVSKVSVGAIWKGATFLRLKKAIKDTFCDEPEREGVRQMRDTLLKLEENEATSMVDEGALQRWLDKGDRSASQKRAILATAGKRIAVIRGPPGTGKSATIAELVAAHINMYRKGATKEAHSVMVLTPTNNTAQDNLRKIKALMVPDRDGRETPVDVSWAVSRSFGQRVQEDTRAWTVGYKATHMREADGSRNIGWDRLREWQEKLDKGKRLTLDEEKCYRMLHKAAVKATVKKSEVIVGTVQQAGLALLKEKKFGLIVIDEAGLVDETMAIAAVALGPTQMVLVGDEAQMKVRQSSSEGTKLKVESIFHRVVRILGEQAVTLTEHWRMCEACVAPVNKTFYKGQLTVQQEVNQKRRTDIEGWQIFEDSEKPLTWVDVNGTEEKEEGMGKSTLNKCEASTCLEVIKWIMKTAKAVTQNDIAVIAGYAAQVTHMEAMLQQEGLKDVSTGTIDKWQGGEKKIVIISTVRTGMPPKGQFISDTGRLCVTFSRCTHAMIVVGRKTSMRGINNEWRDVIEEIESQGGRLKQCFDVDNTEEMLKDQRRTRMAGGEVHATPVAIPERHWRLDTRCTKRWAKIMIKCFRREIEGSLVQASAWITGTKPWGVQSQEADGEEMRIRKAMDSQMKITEQEKQELEQEVTNLKSQATMENWWTGRQKAQAQLARGKENTDEDREKWHNPETRLQNHIELLKEEGKMDAKQCEELKQAIEMRQRGNERRFRYEKQYKADRLRAKVLGMMLFTVYLQHETRQWTRQHPMTAKDLERLNPLGGIMGGTKDDSIIEEGPQRLKLEDDLEGVSKGMKALAIGLGSTPGEVDGWGHPMDTIHIAHMVREMMSKSTRRKIWTLHTGGWNTKQDLIGARKRKKHKHDLQRMEQGFKSKSAELTAMIDYLAKPQHYSRIESVTLSLPEETERMQQWMSSWRWSLCWIRAHEQCTRLWQGRWKDIGSTVKRGLYHEKWDEWIWTRVARDEKMNMNDETWYDEGTLVEWKGHEELLTTYKKRAAVQREVGRRWHEEHAMSEEQRAWIRDECGTEEHWERTEANWSRSIVRWLHYPHSDDLMETAKQVCLGEKFVERAWMSREDMKEETVVCLRFHGGIIRDVEGCNTTRITLKEATARRWNMHTQARDMMLQQEWGSFVSDKDGLELEFIHCNRNGTAWTLDRHDRKVGEQIQTGKGPSQRQRPGETTRELVDETEELCNMELNDKQMEKSGADSNGTEISSCTKICSSERGGNIQHEETNAVSYGDTTDDEPEAKKFEADVATICTNASVSHEELEQCKGNDGWVYLDKIRQEIMTNARERVGEDLKEDGERHGKTPQLIESGKVVGQGIGQYWETKLKCPDGMYMYQIVIIRVNGVTAHAYTEQFSQRESVTDEFRAMDVVQIGNYAHHPVVDHFTWLWAEEQDHAQGWKRSETDEMCWVHCKGVDKIIRPGGHEVIGRWHRTTPKGRGDKRSVKQMIEERISEQERQQEWPITAWIKKVSTVHDKNRIQVDYKADVRQIQDMKKFSESIKDLLVVPYETIGYRLDARGDATHYSDIWGKRWPECVVGMVTHSKSPDERTTVVNVGWEIVQECRRKGYEIRGLKAKRKKTRKSIKEGAFPEGGVVSKEAHSADAGSSEKPHGGVPRGRASGGIQTKRAGD